MSQAASETNSRAIHQARANPTWPSRASAPAPATPFESLLDDSAPADAPADAPSQAKTAPADASQKTKAPAKGKTDKIANTANTTKTATTQNPAISANSQPSSATSQIGADGGQTDAVNPADSQPAAVIAQAVAAQTDAANSAGSQPAAVIAQAIAAQTDAAKSTDDAAGKADAAAITAATTAEQVVTGNAVKAEKAGTPDKPDGDDPAGAEASSTTPAAVAANPGAVVVPAAAVVAPGAGNGAAAAAAPADAGVAAAATVDAVVVPVAAALAQAVTTKSTSDAIAPDGSKDASKNGAQPTQLAALQANAGQAAGTPLATATKDTDQTAVPAADKKSAAPAEGELAANAPAAASALHADAPKAGSDNAQPLTLPTPAQQPAPASATAPANAGAPTPPPASPAAAVPLAGVAIEIAGRALAGKNRFEIRLDPPELGRIEVHLDVAHDGRITTHMVADRSDTLALLRSDASGLQRALQDAGLKTADNGLQFSLRDQTAGQQQQPQLSGSDKARRISDDDKLAAIDLTQAAPTRYVTRVGGIDIRV